MNERPSLGRLTKVELRKAVDTRAGFWLLLSVLGLTVVTVVISYLAGNEFDHTFRHVLGNALVPAATLLPVIGILLVTSEWSQRTALVSFALVPDRGRLIAAKVLAGSLLAVLAWVMAIVFAAIGTAFAGSDAPHVWTLPAGLLGQDLVYAVTAMLIGLAFGAAFLASAPAIVLYFGLPAAVGAIGAIHSLHGTVEWISTSSLEPLTQNVMNGHEWAQALVTLVLWLVAPLVFGLWRITHKDVG